jgi:hypothetical protein
VHKVTLETLAGHFLSLAIQNSHALNQNLMADTGRRNHIGIVSDSSLPALLNFGPSSPGLGPFLLPGPGWLLCRRAWEPLPATTATHLRAELTASSR